MFEIAYEGSETIKKNTGVVNAKFNKEFTSELGRVETLRGRDEKGHPRPFTGNVTFLFYMPDGEYAGAHGVFLFSHTYFANVLLRLLNIE